MSDPQSNPASTDPEQLRREGEEAENARMAEETRTYGGTTRGAVPWDTDEAHRADAGNKARTSSPAAGRRDADS